MVASPAATLILMSALIVVSVVMLLPKVVVKSATQAAKAVSILQAIVPVAKSAIDSSIVLNVAQCLPTV